MKAIPSPVQSIPASPWNRPPKFADPICNPNCTLAPYCGDGIKNGPEACDNGTNNVPMSSAYGPGVCTSVWTWAPYCGDGRVQPQFGEQCDSAYDCTPSCQNASAM